MKKSLLLPENTGKTLIFAGNYVGHLNNKWDHFVVFLFLQLGMLDFVRGRIGDILQPASSCLLALGELGTDLPVLPRFSLL
jgi:hypothetical protein